MKRLAIPLVLLLLASGCIAGQGDDEAPSPTGSAVAGAADGVNLDALSQPVFELDSITETFLESHDGTVLHAAEYHPNVTEDDKTPVVIQLSPYFGNLAGEAQAQPNAYFVEQLVERGYTVVFASVRGTGYSGGCYQLGGPTEVQDAYELVKHYHEADWSNGKVGLIGVSYPGTTPWQAAIADPPGLETIVPIEGISDMYRYMFREGAAYTHGPLFPTYYTALTDWVITPNNADQVDHVLGPLGAACPDVAETIANGYRTWADGNHDAFWDERDYEAQADKINTSVFVVQGFQDWNVDPDNQIPLFAELDVPKKAWLGQWAHNIPFGNSYNSDWDRHDWNLTMVAWFDHWLKGIDNGIMSEPPVLAQTSQGDWHREQAWPPERTQTHQLFLAPDEQLTSEPDADAGSIMLGPWLGDFGGEMGETLPGEEQLTFASEGLPQDTLIVGQPTLTVNLTTDQPDGHLVAYLHDLDAEEHGELGHAIVNLAHRDSRDRGELMPLGQTTQVSLEFYPLDAWVPAGHRLGFTVLLEDGSRIHPSPFTPTYEIHLDAEQPSVLSFEVLPDPVFEPAPEQDETLWAT